MQIVIFSVSIYIFLSLFFEKNFAALIPTKSAEIDDIHAGIIISNGEAEPAASRRAITVEGISVIDAVFITTNIHIEFDALK